MKNFKLFNIKPKMILCAIAVGGIIILTGCTRNEEVGLEARYDRALIKFENQYKVIEIKGVKQEADSDTIVLTLAEGTPYLTNSLDSKVFSSESEIVSSLLEEQKIR